MRCAWRTDAAECHASCRAPVAVRFYRTSDEMERGNERCDERRRERRRGVRRQPGR
jgi:hypothetical protein